MQQRANEKILSLVSIPQVRLIELISIFCIVYVAKEIAGFTYRSGLIITLFLGAAFLNLLAAGLENIYVRHTRGLPAERRFWLWTTIFIDLVTALGLIYLTGTVESPFIFILIVPLFFAGRLLPTLSAGFKVTAITVAAVSTLGFLELKGLIPHFSCYTGNPAITVDGKYLMGTVLALGGFMSLMAYLFSTYYGNFQVFFQSAEDRLLSSRRRIIELTRLYDISLGINSVISLDTLLKMVCKEITLLLRRPWASVILLNQKQEIVKHVELGNKGAVNIETGEVQKDDPLVQKILGFEEGIVIDDICADPKISGSLIVSGRKLDTLLVAPILSGRERQGILVVGDVAPEPFTREDVRLLTILSGQVATAIEKSKLYEVMSGRINRLGKENDTLQNDNKLKMSYISHLSHELKTPLTSIKAYVESLKENIDDPGFEEKEDFLDVIASETDRLIRMVNKVLDVSKIEFGQRTLKRKLFPLPKLVSEVELALQPYLVGKELRLVVDLPPVLPLIDGDEDLIKQVFINLVNNAGKFSSRDARIFVEAVEDAVSVKVTIRDEGMGIPEEDLKNIFKQFYQVKTQTGEGVGLGLAIVKNIIEQHGGSIQVSSREGEGSTFTFTLPKEHHFNDLLGYIFDSMDAREEIQEMFKLGVTVIAEMLSAKIVSLMLLDRDRKELFIKSAYGLEEHVVARTRVKIGSGIAGKVAESGQGLLVEDIEKSGFKTTPNHPQYETKSFLSVPLRVGSTVIGVINVNNKTENCSFTEDDLTLLTSLSQRLSKVIERIRTAEDSNAFLGETIQSLRSMLASCERDAEGEIQQIVAWSVQVARKLGLSDKEIQVVQYISSVHDVGMTCVSDRILKKTLDLTPEEIEEIRKHPQEGEAIIRPLEFVELASQSILFHHERIDGKGYPMGLKGDQIPIGSRVLAVLDAYISMISERPFRKRISNVEAVNELVKHSGTQFDSKVVAAFIEVLMDDGLVEVEEYTRISDGLRCSTTHHVAP